MQTDEQLVQDLPSESALQRLLDRHWDRAVRTARLWSPDGAEDAAQVAFLRLLESSSSFDPARRFLPWFLQIVRNTSKNASRAQAIRRRHETQAARREATESSDPEARNLVRRHLSALTPEKPDPLGSSLHRRTHVSGNR